MGHKEAFITVIPFDLFCDWVIPLDLYCDWIIPLDLYWDWVQHSHNSLSFVGLSMCMYFFYLEKRCAVLPGSNREKSSSLPFVFLVCRAVEPLYTYGAYKFCQSAAFFIFFSSKYNTRTEHIYFVKMYCLVFCWKCRKKIPDYHVAFSY